MSKNDATTYQLEVSFLGDNMDHLTDKRYPTQNNPRYREQKSCIVFFKTGSPAIHTCFYPTFVHLRSYINRL